ncbi:MAG: hypothetical protein ACK4NC_03905 [Candidatus Gracilibacteria bacterium]
MKKIHTIYDHDGSELLQEYMKNRNMLTFDEMISWLILKEPGMKDVLSEFSSYYKKLKKSEKYPTQTPFDLYFHKNLSDCLSCQYMQHKVEELREDVDLTETFTEYCTKKIKALFRKK